MEFSLVLGLQHKHRPEFDVSHLISAPPCIFLTLIMTCSKTKAKGSGDRA
jgi:hypothetical protein